jgi:hypothetical protein
VDKTLKNQLATKEEIKLIKTILTELTRHAESDISVFSVDVRRWKEDDEGFPMDAGKSNHQEGVYRSMRTWIDIEFAPARNQNHPNREIDKVELCWCSQTGEFTVELCYSQIQPNGRGGNNRVRDEQHNETFWLGSNLDLGGDYAKLKVEFLRLYKKVRHHQDVVIPAKKREAFENAVYGTFPALLDNLLMENDDEQEKS